MRRRLSRVGGLLAALVLGLVAAGCGGAIPSKQGATGVKLASSTMGRFLVDAQGHTLYLWAADKRNDSYCAGACAAVWPPFEADSTPHALAGVPASALGLIKRNDGEMQVTYMGHPLYYYAADASTPGRTTGQDIDQFGAAWYLVGSNGKAVEAGNGKKGSNDNSNNGTGGGY